MVDLAASLFLEGILCRGQCVGRGAAGGGLGRGRVVSRSVSGVSNAAMIFARPVRHRLEPVINPTGTIITCVDVVKRNGRF